MMKLGKFSQDNFKYENNEQSCDRYTIFFMSIDIRFRISM